jgi:site-specific DNA-methyltransferase (adenine-specific)
MEKTSRIFQGDCADVLRSHEADSVDFVLADPPYLARYLDRTGRTVVNDDRGAWLYPSFAEIYRVLKPGRFCVSFYGWPHTDRFLGAWRAIGFRPVGHIVWRKKYASSRSFLAYCHEQAFLLAKGDPKKPDKPMNDVLEWNYTGNRLHPTQKPVGALTPLIRAFSQEGELVLDPFCGSGSTLVAAASLGRDYLGIEIDPEHYETACTRLAS